MEQRKQCPACGEFTDHSTDRCPHCNLEGLNQLFLSRADYDRWVNTVLKPHAGRFFRRVITGTGAQLLILTGAGELYGMGRNYSGQILEDGEDIISAPVLMASGVVSAAASGFYSIFATEDGRIHIRGRGELSERVPEFTDAKEVFIRDSKFFVVNSHGQVYCFGDNRDGTLEPAKEEVLAVFPEKTHKKGPYYEPNTPFSRNEYIPSRHDPKEDAREVYNTIAETPEYRVLAARYENANLDLQLNAADPRITGPEYVHGSTYRKYNVVYHYEPKLIWRNDWIYTPIPCHDQSFGNTPHRYHGQPLDPADRPLYGSDPQIKKICAEFLNCTKAAVILSYDGMLTWFDYQEVPHRLDWPNEPIHDVALGPYADNITISCRDGKVYILDTYPLPKVKITKELTF